MSRAALKVAALLATALVLLACSPKLDWRTVQSPQGRYSALFPGKPDKLERQIPYLEQEFLQTLEAVKIDDDIYSVGSIKLLPNQTELLPNLIKELQSNLLDRARASGGSVEVLDTSYQLSSRQKLASKDYFLVLKSNGKASQLMRVRWITRPAPNGDMWIYQISALHPSGSGDDARTFLSKEEYENFFSGFSPE